MSGVKFEVGYTAMLESFTEILESRKEGLGGSWFTAPGESSADAFMRRLRTADPAHAIFQAYAEEHKERWEGAKAMSMAEAMNEMPEIERKYKLECAAYDNVVFGMSDEFTGVAKLEQEKLSKMVDGGELQGLLDNGSYVAIEDGVIVKDASAVAAMRHSV